MIGLILYEESREKSKTAEQPQEEQCMLFPDQVQAEYNTMVGVDTELAQPVSNFNKRMYRHHKEHGTDMSFENENLK